MASNPGTDRYRPHYEASDGARKAPGDEQEAMYHFQGNHGQGRGHPPRRGDFTFRQAQRSRIYDRPLLTEVRASSPDTIFRDRDTPEKFRHVDEHTASEDEDMDVSRSDDDGDQAPRKRLSAIPLWSNPDPYTALPPVTENPKKKQDVVKLIRRSRLIPSGARTNAIAVDDEDFISLDMSDSNLDKDAGTSNKPPVNAPTGPKIQSVEPSTQLGKRKREALDEIIQLPPRSNKGARFHQRGKILREWAASDSEFSTPWYRPPTTPAALAGVA